MVTRRATHSGTSPPLAFCRKSGKLCCDAGAMVMSDFPPLECFGTCPSHLGLCVANRDGTTGYGGRCFALALKIFHDNFSGNMPPILPALLLSSARRLWALFSSRPQGQLANCDTDEDGDYDQYSCSNRSAMRGVAAFASIIWVLQVPCIFRVFPAALLPGKARRAMGYCTAVGTVSTAALCRCMNVSDRFQWAEYTSDSRGLLK